MKASLLSSAISPKPYADLPEVPVEQGGGEAVSALQTMLDAANAAYAGMQAYWARPRATNVLNAVVPEAAQAEFQRMKSDPALWARTEARRPPSSTEVYGALELQFVTPEFQSRIAELDALVQKQKITPEERLQRKQQLIEANVKQDRYLDYLVSEASAAVHENWPAVIHALKSKTPLEAVTTGPLQLAIAGFNLLTSFATSPFAAAGQGANDDLIRHGANPKVAAAIGTIIQSTPEIILTVQQLSGVMQGQRLGLPAPDNNAGMMNQAAEAIRGAEKQMNTPVYHGTPNEWQGSAPDMSKIGTGQGAQSYGHGLYFAENPKVAASYMGQDTSLVKRMASAGNETFELSDLSAMAIQQGNIDTAIAQARARVDWANRSSMAMHGAIMPEVVGPPEKELSMLLKLKATGSPIKLQSAENLYKATIDDSHIAKMLDWDKPLSEQAPGVKKALAETDLPKWLRFKFGDRVADPTGQQIYEAMTMKVPDRYPLIEQQSGASNALKSLGIPGIKYLDQGSRGNLQATPAMEIALRNARALLSEATDAARKRTLQAHVDDLTRRLAETRTTRNFVVFDPGIIKNVSKQ